MIELRQRLRLEPVVGRNLQRNEPAQRALAGQEHAAEGAAAQPHQQVEVVNALARFEIVDFRNLVQGAGQAGPIRGQQIAELRDLLRKTYCVFLDRDAFAMLPANVNFLVDQIVGQQAFGRKLRKLNHVLFQPPAPLAPRPAPLEVDFHQFNQSQPPQARRRRRQMRSQRRGFGGSVPGVGESFETLAKLLPNERRRIARRPGCVGEILTRGFRHGANRSNGSN